MWFFFYVCKKNYDFQNKIKILSRLKVFEIIFLEENEAIIKYNTVLKIKQFL